MTETGKKLGEVPRGPKVNPRQGDYNGDDTSSLMEKLNPTGGANTIRVCSIPKTVEQESEVGAGIKL